MTARAHGFGRRCALAVPLLLVVAAGVVATVPARADATAHPTSTTGSSPHDAVEVWKVHPTKSAARAAHVTLRISDVSAGDRGALMVVEDRHIPLTPFDTGGVYGFAYAELGNDDDYPRAYDNADGVRTPDCPLPSSCLGLTGRPMTETPLTFTFSKVVDAKGHPYAYDFRDFYVGAVNAHLTVVPLSAGWSVTRATDADMVLVQNTDTARGVGVRAANYTVEQVNGEIAVKTPNAVWSAAYVRLPCSADVVPYRIPQGRATFSGLTIPYGRRTIPLACDHTYAANGMATGPTTWRLTSESSGEPEDAGSVAATQNVNRMTVLIVNRPKPTSRSSKVAAAPSRTAHAVRVTSAGVASSPPYRPGLQRSAFATVGHRAPRHGPVPAVALLVLAVLPALRALTRLRRTA
jgi:hypothetical protein